MSKFLIIAPRVSEGARALMQALRERGLNGLYRRRDQMYGTANNVTHVVNWGCGGDDVTARSVNAGLAPLAVALNRHTDVATNKLHAFEAMARYSTANLPGNGIRTPSFTTSISNARHWADRGGVFCRTQLRGHSGTDIVVARGASGVVPAPLYTKLVDKRHEFRLHVFNGVVIDGVRKAFSSEVPEEERNRDVMNHAAGTIFVRSGPALEAAHQNRSMHTMAINACNALGLQFGAVDIMTDREGRPYILEVNTAPGLEATTLDRYADAMFNWINGQQPLPWTQLSLNPTTQTQTQTEETNMSTLLTPRTQTGRQRLVGLQVTPNSTFTGSSLSQGTHYVIEDYSYNAGTDLVKIKIRTDRLRSYTLSGQFDVVTTGQATTTPAPATVAPAPIQPHPTGVRIDVPANSPERCIRLPQDQSAVNVGGTVVYRGSDSSLLTNGNRYTVVDIRCREDDNTAVFLGIEIEGRVRRWNRENFTDGQVVLQTQARPEAPVATPQNLLTDINGVNVEVGANVVIVTRAGGHGFYTGTRGTVREIRENNHFLFQSQGGERSRVVRGNRIRKITSTEHQQIQQLESQINTTINVSVGTNQFQIRQSNRDRLIEIIRGMTV